MRIQLPLLLTPLAIACSGSGSGSDGGGTWRAEREVRGDTTIVRTVAGQAWDAPREIQIDLSIGALEGPEETMFGRISAIAVDSLGGVYVYDAQVPAIRYFDAEGSFVRQVGRDGAGPGEYLDAVLGMALRSDGRLQIRDARNSRVTLYHPDGSYSGQWLVASGLFTSQAMFLDRNDHTYLKILQEQPQRGQAWKIGLLHYDPAGSLMDTIPDPWVPDAPGDGGGSLSPTKQWTFGPDGSMIVGVNGTYQFEIRRPDGAVTRIERDVPPIPVSDAEYDAYEARRQYMIRTQGQFMTTLPGETGRVKPAYRGLYASPSGRIWVHLYGPVEPKPDYEPAAEGQRPVWPFIEHKLYDVFEPDGTYLGQVRAPQDVDIHLFGDEVIWGVRTGEMEEGYVVRGHVVPVTSGGTERQ
jgi:hypothetical protein